MDAEHPYVFGASAAVWHGWLAQPWRKACDVPHGGASQPCHTRYRGACHTLNTSGDPPRKGLSGAAAIIVVLLAAALAAGCTIFPHGAYWPPMARRAPESGPVEPHAAELPHAPAASDALPPIAEAAARRAALQPRIAARWADENLARSARDMNGALGRAVYADAMQTVVWCYVEPVSYRRLIVAGLESLRAALDNPAFRRRFPEAADDERRGRFAEALDIMLLKARGADPWFAFQASDWLAAVCEKNRATLGLPDGAAVSEFLFGAMDSLDPYSRYLTPDMLRPYREQMAGEYAGIGAEIAARDGRIFIKTVFEGGPAAKAGLKAGDEIVAVAGEPVAGLSTADLTRRLRGRPGDAVTLSIRAGGKGEPRDVVLVRGTVHLPAVRDAQVLDAARGIAYVRFTDFQDGAEAELRQAIDGLSRQGAKALVLDLRDNPGGSLLEAVWAAGMFLDGGPVLRTRGRMLGATWGYDVPLFEGRAWRGPLAVLVNERTASASEVVASALKARGRAAVIGRRTYGKGAVQVLFPVDWGAAAVCLTMARVYDVKGVCVDGRSVVPDCEVAAPASPPESLAADPDVRAAVELLGAGAK
ncbi:MAG: S41 family peptidase [Planctomycetota bacterium]|nr:S41 family peptidase [Planctomycetota bacterium]